MPAGEGARALALRPMCSASQTRLDRPATERCKRGGPAPCVCACVCVCLCVCACVSACADCLSAPRDARVAPHVRSARTRERQVASRWDTHMRRAEAKATLWSSRSHVRLGSIRCFGAQVARWRSSMSRPTPRARRRRDWTARLSTFAQISQPMGANGCATRAMPHRVLTVEPTPWVTNPVLLSWAWARGAARCGKDMGGAG